MAKPINFSLLLLLSGIIVNSSFGWAASGQNSESPFLLADANPTTSVKDPQVAAAAVTQPVVTQPASFGMEIPEWLKRTDFGIEAGTDQKLNAYFETVQPLYQDDGKQNTIFVEPRVSIYQRQGTYNFGGGYRRLLNDNQILLGINSFYDYQSYHNHYRVGVGEEAFVNIIEFRANQYMALSPARVVSQSGSQTEYERAMNGADWELGLPLPYMNWIKLFGGGYGYNHKYGPDELGWKSRLEFSPFRFLTINFNTSNDNYSRQEYGVDARVSLAFGPQNGKKDKFCNIGFSDVPYPDKVDHSDQVLKRVEREYTIRVERYIKTAAATIEIRRGN